MLNDHTEYTTWLAIKKHHVDAGNVAEFLAWYIDNPSPVGGLFGRELTRAEVVRQAVEAAAAAFAGTKVEIRHTETPEFHAQVCFVLTGTLVGQAFVCAGNTSQLAVMIQNEHGAFVVIPSKNVIGMENAA